MTATTERIATINERELAKLREDLRAIRPDLADRLDELIRAQASLRGEYVRLGEASQSLGVSRNTLKKWIRGGLVRDVMQLPDSGEMRVARAEIARLHDYALRRVAMSTLGDAKPDAGDIPEMATSGTPPWRR